MSIYNIQFVIQIHSLTIFRSVRASSGLYGTVSTERYKNIKNYQFLMMRLDLITESGFIGQYTVVLEFFKGLNNKYFSSVWGPGKSIEICLKLNKRYIIWMLRCIICSFNEGRKSRIKKASLSVLCL